MNKGLIILCICIVISSLILSAAILLSGRYELRETAEKIICFDKLTGIMYITAKSDDVTKIIKYNTLTARGGKVDG